MIKFNYKTAIHILEILKCKLIVAVVITFSSVINNLHNSSHMSIFTVPRPTTNKVMVMSRIRSFECMDVIRSSRACVDIDT